MKKLFLLSFSIILIFAKVLCFADFDDLGAGAKAIGMGNAYSALADDPFGFYYNPAGLGFLQRGQIGADYGKLWLGLDDKSDISQTFVGISVPFFKSMKASPDISTSAPAETKISTSTIKAKYKTMKIHRGTFAFGYRQFSLLDYYSETTYYFGFGKLYNFKWAWGINLKALQEKYVIDEYLVRSPVFDYGETSTVSNFSVDLGGIYNISPRLFFGISAADINRPDLGLKEKAELPSTIRMGIGLKEKHIRWAADAIYKDKLWYGAFGLEKHFAKMFAVRGGINFGGLNYVQPAIGFSFNFIPAQIDYVFQYPMSGIKDVGGNHRMSFVYRFGTAKSEEMEPGSIEYYYAKLQERAEYLEASLAQTEEEKRRLEEVLVDEATARIQERINSAKLKAKTSFAKSSDSPKEKESRYTVKKGDTLQMISQKFYGDSKFWMKIYIANKDKVGRGGYLKPKTELTIPALSNVEKPEPAGSENEPDKGTSQVIPVEIKPVEVLIPVKTKTDTGDANIVPVEASTPVPVQIEAEPKKEEKKEEPKKPKGPRKHVVKSKENLKSIAKKYYNDSSKWRDIYKANKGKIVGGQVVPGQEIIIP